MKSCKECGKEGCLLNATEGYCLDCPECGVNWKEKKMEFDKSRCYTSLNADELKAGDKVIAACAISTLKRQIETDSKYIKVREIYRIADDKTDHRFRFKDGGQPSAPFAYLVERKENCTNCGKTECAGHGEHEDFKVAVCSNWIPKAEPKTEQKAYEYDVPIKGQINEDGVVVERQVGKCHVKFKPYTEEARKAYVCAMTNACPEKHYRPFKDTDELVKVWCEKGGKWQKRELTMPLIWVRRKDANSKGQLITEFGDDLHVSMGKEGYNMTDLFVYFTFLDRTPCGVEE